MANAKQPRLESTPTQQEKATFQAIEDATYASRPSSSSTPPSSFRVEASLASIMDQIQLMRADFGSRLDHLTDKMYQMITRISCIAR